MSWQRPYEALYTGPGQLPILIAARSIHCFRVPGNDGYELVVFKHRTSRQIRHEIERTVNKKKKQFYVGWRLVKSLEKPTRRAAEGPFRNVLECHLIYLSIHKNVVNNAGFCFRCRPRRGEVPFFVGRRRARRDGENMWKNWRKPTGTNCRPFVIQFVSNRLTRVCRGLIVLKNFRLKSAFCRSH